MENNCILNHSVTHPAYLMCREPRLSVQNKWSDISFQTNKNQILIPRGQRSLEHQTNQTLVSYVQHANQQLSASYTCLWNDLLRVEWNVNCCSDIHFCTTHTNQLQNDTIWLLKIISTRAESQCMTNLGEIADEMMSVIIRQCKDVEDKWFDVVIQRLVVQKQLG